MPYLYFITEQLVYYRARRPDWSELALIDVDATQSAPQMCRSLTKVTRQVNNILRYSKNINLLIRDNEYAALRLFESMPIRCITSPTNHHLRQNGVLIDNTPVQKKNTLDTSNKLTTSRARFNSIIIFSRDPQSREYRKLS